MGKQPVLKDVAKELREELGLTVGQMARRIGVATATLQEFEDGMDDRFVQSYVEDSFMRELNIDLTTYAWCQMDDVSSLPAPVREAARRLTDSWKEHIDGIKEQIRMEQS